MTTSILWARLAQFFAAPLLKTDAAQRELEVRCRGFVMDPDGILLINNQVNDSMMVNDID